MYPYRKAQLDLFLTLVNESNPGLYTDLTSSNIQVGMPSVQAVPVDGIQNTNVLMTAKGGDYLGTKRVEYRRIDVTKYFRGMSLSLETWTAVNSLQPAEFCEVFNAKYGTALVPSDLAQTVISYGPNVAIDISNQPLCYEPGKRIRISITRTKRPFEQMFTGDTLDGRLFPSGNDFPVERKPQGEYLLYGLDCSPIRSTLAAIASGTTLNFANATHLTVLEFLQAKAPALNFSNSAATVAGGLTGLKLYQYTLPQALIPEANSEKYLNASYIAPEADSWFQGNLILHNGLR